MHVFFLLLALAFPEELDTPELPAPFSPETWLVYTGDQALPVLLFEWEAPTDSSEDWRVRESARLEPSTTLAYCTFEADKAHVRMARLSGAETLFVNGEPFWGDPDSRGHRGVPVPLREGTNHLFVTGVRAETELELWAPEKRLIVATWDVEPPNISNRMSEWFSCLHFPILNASIEIADGLHVHYGRAVPESEGPYGIGEWRDGGRIPPLAMFPANVTFMARDEDDEGNWIDLDREIDDEAALIRLSVWVGREEGADEPVVRVPFGVPARETERLPNSAFRSLIRRAPIRQLVTDPPQSGTAFVYGTGGTEEEASALLAAARYDQARLAYRTGCMPVLVSDEDYVRKLEGEDTGHWYARNDRVVLYGNLSTNSAISAVVPAREEIMVARGTLRVGNTTRNRDDLHGYAVLDDREQPRRYVALVANTGLAGIRHSFLDDFYFAETDAAVRFSARGDVVVSE